MNHVFITGRNNIFFLIIKGSTWVAGCFCWDSTWHKCHYNLMRLSPKVRDCINSDWFPARQEKWFILMNRCHTKPSSGLQGWGVTGSSTEDNFTGWVGFTQTQNIDWAETEKGQKDHVLLMILKGSKSLERATRSCVDRCFKIIIKRKLYHFNLKTNFCRISWIQH